MANATIVQRSVLQYFFAFYLTNVTTTPIIYEVNLSIARRRLGEFDAWLLEHVEQMLDLPGFTGATTYDIDGPDDATAVRSVHYTLRDQAALDRYFDEHAERMRADGVSRFGRDMGATRRVLASHQRRDGARCGNCGIALAGQYCADCGQRHRTRMISLWEMLRDVFEDAFSWDSRLWRSVRPLLLAPGKLTREYLGGRRMYYTPPLRMYLVLSITFFLLSSLPFFKNFDAGTYLNFDGSDDLSLTITNGDDPPSDNDEPDEDTDPSEICDMEDAKFHFPGVSEALVRDKVERACYASMTPEGRRGFLNTFNDLLPKLLIVMLPFTALAGKMIYPRSRRYYVEHLLFYTHFHSFIFLLLILLMGISAIAARFEVLTAGATLLKIAVAAYVIYYLYRALRKVFGQGRWATLFKMLLIWVSYNIGASFLTLTGMAIAALSI